MAPTQGGVGVQASAHGSPSSASPTGQHVLLGLRFQELSWDHTSPEEEESVLWLEFDGDNEGTPVNKLLKIYSKQVVVVLRALGLGAGQTIGGSKPAGKEARGVLRPGEQGRETLPTWSHPSEWKACSGDATPRWVAAAVMVAVAEGFPVLCDWPPWLLSPGPHESGALRWGAGLER